LSSFSFFFNSSRAAFVAPTPSSSLRHYPHQINAQFGYKKIPCDTCHLSKSTRLSFMLSSSKANKMFDLVHSDVWGPIIESFDGYKYFVSFVDDFSHVTWIYLLKSKSEVVYVFQNFHMLVMT